VIKGGLSRGIVYLCWPGMVPNQRQLFIVVSDWGSYLGSHFPIVICGIWTMFVCSCVLHCMQLHISFIRFIVFVL
jgi:hypothetical protein